MDQRIVLLIDGARRTHTPIWWVRKEAGLADTADPWCCGCEGIVSHKKCPVLAAAKELVDEAEESS
jgi:hypothetical protein